MLFRSATPFGKRFADGYKGLGTNCNDETHNHISPSGEIDATTAFLPENTWFVDGQHHAMFQYENYGLDLAAKAVCTDELKNIYSDPDYPQFRVSDNPHRGVYAEFDKSSSGYINVDDTKLIIENTYKDNKIRLVSVRANGIDIKFDDVRGVVLKPGEKLELPFSGDVDRADTLKSVVTVRYLKIDSISTVTERTFNFSVLSENVPVGNKVIVDNEYYNGDTSGMSFVERVIYAMTYVIDMIRVLSDFISSDTFSFLL